MCVTEFLEYYSERGLLFYGYGRGLNFLTSQSTLRVYSYYFASDYLSPSTGCLFISASRLRLTKYRFSLFYILVRKYLGLVQSAFDLGFNYLVVVSALCRAKEFINDSLRLFVFYQTLFLILIRNRVSYPLYLVSKITSEFYDSLNVVLADGGKDEVTYC